MSSQTKIIAAVGGLLIVITGAFYVFVANKPPAAPQTERGYHAP